MCGVECSVPSSPADQSHTGISTYCTAVVLLINTAFHCLVAFCPVPLISQYFDNAILTLY